MFEKESYYLCSMQTIREIIFSKEFDEFYNNLDYRTQEKYDYAFDMIRIQYVVNNALAELLTSGQVGQCFKPLARCSHRYGSRIALITRIFRCAFFHHGGDGFNGFFCEHCMLTWQCARSLSVVSLLLACECFSV